MTSAVVTSAVVMSAAVVAVVGASAVVSYDVVVTSAAVTSAVVRFAVEFRLLTFWTLGTIIGTTDAIVTVGYFPELFSAINKTGPAYPLASINDLFHPLRFQDPACWTYRASNLACITYCTSTVLSPEAPFAVVNAFIQIPVDICLSSRLVLITVCWLMKEIKTNLI